jgi:hypothetical protein
MSYWRRISPRGAISDFIEEWRRPRPYRWQILGLAVAITFAGMVFLIPDSQRIPPARPDVTYITTWEEGRTDEEIAASNAANQARKEEAAKLAAEQQALKREAYRALARASGFDPDELERAYSDDEPEGADGTPQSAQPARESPPAGE